MIRDRRMVLSVVALVASVLALSWFQSPRASGLRMSELLGLRVGQTICGNDTLYNMDCEKAPVSCPPDESGCKETKFEDECYQALGVRPGPNPGYFTFYTETCHNYFSAYYFKGDCAPVYSHGTYQYCERGTATLLACPGDIGLRDMLPF